MSHATPYTKKYASLLLFAALTVAFSLYTVVARIATVYGNESRIAAIYETSNVPPRQVAEAVLGATTNSCISKDQYLKTVVMLIPDFIIRNGTEVLRIPTNRILNCRSMVNETTDATQNCTQYSLTLDNLCVKSLLTSTYRFSEPTELIRSKKTGVSVESRIADQKVDYAVLADQITDLLQKTTTLASVTSPASMIRSPTITAPLLHKEPNTDGKLSPRYIETDGSRQLLFLWENGSYTTYRMSGAFEQYNPVGIHQIINQSPLAWSRPTSKWMPYWQAFTFDANQNAMLGIHGLVYWYPGYTKTGTKKIFEPVTNIGKPKSTGCLRLTVEDARTVYKWAKVGDYVVVHN